MLERSVPWILATAMLAGCVSPPQQGSGAPVRAAPPPEQEVAVPVVVEVPVPEDVKQLAELVAYGQRAGLMSAEEQKRELAATAAAYNRDKSAYARMRLALLYSLPGTTVQDDARALALLEPYASASHGSGALRQFAALLHANVAERVRVQKRADQLKEQLEALRAVERSIIDRGLESQPRKP